MKAPSQPDPLPLFLFFSCHRFELSPRRLFFRRFGFELATAVVDSDRVNVFPIRGEISLQKRLHLIRYQYREVWITLSDLVTSDRFPKDHWSPARAFWYVEIYQLDVQRSSTVIYNANQS